MLPVGFLLFALIAASNPQLSPPLACTKKLVMPTYPKLAKIAHDARVVSARVRVSEGGCLQVVEVKGGNKYYDEAIKTAISRWLISPTRPLHICEFNVIFDFKLTEDATKDGLFEIDLDDGRITAWGLLQYTDIEQLPIATK